MQRLDPAERDIMIVVSVAFALVVLALLWLLD